MTRHNFANLIERAEQLIAAIDKWRGMDAVCNRIDIIDECLLKMDARKDVLVQLEKKSVRVSEERRNIVKTKERIQMVLNDLNLKKVVEGDEGIADALNAINDSLGSLGTNYEDPSVDDLLAPDKASKIKMSFDEIMAE